MKRIFPAFALLLLASCTPDPVWTRPGGTEETFKQESLFCEKIARKSAQKQSGTAALSTMYDMCMFSSGWEKKAITSEKPVTISPAAKAYNDKLWLVMTDYRAATDACERKRRSRIYTNFTQTTACSNNALAASFKRHAFPRMDVVPKITAKGMEVAKNLDKKRITPAQADQEFIGTMKQVLKDAAPE